MAESDISINTFILEEIVKYCRANPKNTFIGIGTAPRTNDHEQFTSRINQVTPIYIDTSKPIRFIHFDTRFNDFIDFLHEHFNDVDMEFEYDDSEGMHIWRTANHMIEVIVNSFNFYHSDEYDLNISEKYDWFLEEMIDTTLNSKKKLIVQSYTGRDTSNIFKNLYEKSNDKPNFKKNILFDVSYGENHCDLDPYKYTPIYDPDNNFINIMLMNFDELIMYISYHPTIKEHITKNAIKEYRKITNVIPVDIRRKMLMEAGRNVMALSSYKNLYTIQSSFDEIIGILKKELMPIIELLREIKFMTPEKESLLQELLTNYKNYSLTSNPDIYKWSDGFIQIIRD